MNDRLTKADWIGHGLRTLANEGANALKVGPMSIALRVSRGSFYWHFEDIADFRSQLLQGWQVSETDQVIADLDARPGDRERLRRLLRRAMSRTRALDRAIRSWAAEDEAVAAIVASVDARRVSGLTRLLIESGVDDARAGARAAFLYWAYLGQAAVMNPRLSSLSDADLDDISNLFEA